jgi:hypothetical protein
MAWSMGTLTNMELHHAILKLKAAANILTIAHITYHVNEKEAGHDVPRLLGIRVLLTFALNDIMLKVMTFTHHPLYCCVC